MFLDQSHADVVVAQMAKIIGGPELGQRGTLKRHIILYNVCGRSSRRGRYDNTCYLPMATSSVSVWVASYTRRGCGGHILQSRQKRAAV
ncbi:hypothetical protein EVAR_40817_1 [Eumeta japonica]|uniref:Uncharacterized protein n=1 Tax=Eumeta variegata TaxID=151549 RepID=A0A4C1WJI3_EUMVA|nr:hypothetical protein EVAR_40817_1 [Eumeta japonica]